MSAPTPPAEWRARVRMYCHGLGDCFLLTFRQGRTVLIDCGVLNPDASRLKAAVADIQHETGGRIDLLVVTHEHWDHVSGFTQARGVFDQMQFGDVWLAWTENPADADAAALHARYDKIKDTLRLAAADPANPVAAQTGELLGFFGANSPALAFSDHSREALDYVIARMHSSAAGGHYCVPGETLEPFGAGVRFHVLGPPHGKLLHKTDPAAGSRETYELALASAIGPAGADASASPFDPGFVVEAANPLYTAAAEAWRRIDQDWLAGSAALALQLDSYTNNTSLALAIELDGGDVLLFPGDAQVGSWQSWRDVAWRQPGVETARLLARTVLYKAGHHASHNGTLRDGGLELMSDLRHVLIPTDEQFALTRNPKGSWQMPAPALYAALDEKSHHSVDRSDQAGADLFIDWYV